MDKINTNLILEATILQRDIFIKVTKYNKLIEEIRARFPLYSVEDIYRPMIIQMPFNIEKEDKNVNRSK